MIALAASRSVVVSLAFVVSLGLTSFVASLDIIALNAWIEI